MLLLACIAVSDSAWGAARKRGRGGHGGQGHQNRVPSMMPSDPLDQQAGIGDTAGTMAGVASSDAVVSDVGLVAARSRSKSPRTMPLDARPAWGAGPARRTPPKTDHLGATAGRSPSTTPPARSSSRPSSTGPEQRQRPLSAGAGSTAAAAAASMPVIVAGDGSGTESMAVVTPRPRAKWNKGEAGNRVSITDADGEELDARGEDGTESSGTLDPAVISLPPSFDGDAALGSSTQAPIVSTAAVASAGAGSPGVGGRSSTSPSAFSLVSPKRSNSPLSGAGLAGAGIALSPSFDHDQSGGGKEDETEEALLGNDGGAGDSSGNGVNPLASTATLAAVPLTSGLPAVTDTLRPEFFIGEKDEHQERSGDEADGEDEDGTAVGGPKGDGGVAGSTSTLVTVVPQLPLLPTGNGTGGSAAAAGVDGGQGGVDLLNPLDQLPGATGGGAAGDGSASGAGFVGSPTPVPGDGNVGTGDGGSMGLNSNNTGTNKLGDEKAEKRATLLRLLMGGTGLVVGYAGGECADTWQRWTALLGLTIAPVVVQKATGTKLPLAAVTNGMMMGELVAAGSRYKGGMLPTAPELPSWETVQAHTVSLPGRISALVKRS